MQIERTSKYIVRMFDEVHVSYFPTVQAGRRVQFATTPVFHELQSQQVSQEEPAKPVTPKQRKLL